MDIVSFLDLARKWDELGSAVQEQLEDVLNFQNLEKQNPNALRIIARFLKAAAEAGIEDSGDWAVEIKEYLETHQ